MPFVKKTKVISEPQRTQKSDIAENLDPNFHYVLVHHTGQAAEEDMASWLDKNYVPATGDEKLKGGPFSTPENNPNGYKIRGNRILMKCPMSEYQARKKEQAQREKEKISKRRHDQELRRLIRETGMSPDNAKNIGDD